MGPEFIVLPCTVNTCALSCSSVSMNLRKSELQKGHLKDLMLKSTTSLLFRSKNKGRSVKKIVPEFCPSICPLTQVVSGTEGPGTPEVSQYISLMRNPNRQRRGSTLTTLIISETSCTI